MGEDPRMLLYAPSNASKLMLWELQSSAVLHLLSSLLEGFNYIFRLDLCLCITELSHAISILQ